MKETRKIQITGGSTFIVSLPSDWVKDRGLHKGSEVFLTNRGTALQVLPVEENATEINKELRVKKGADLTEVQRMLTSVYISNFDIFAIRSNEYIDQGLRDTVGKFARTVMGVEIVEETSNTIVLQNVLKSNTFPMESAARRMILMVETMLADTLKGVIGHDADLLKNVVQRDDEVDRYQWYIYRESRMLSHDNTDNAFYLLLSRVLERIADHATNVCNEALALPKNKPDLTKSISDFLAFNQEMFKESVKCFFSKDIHMMNAVIERKQEVDERRDKVLRKLAGTKETSLNSIVVEEISRIGFYATDIAELAMDRISARSDTITL